MHRFLKPVLALSAAVKRMDTNGNQFTIAQNLPLEEANKMVENFEALGHKQIYWVEQEKKAGFSTDFSEYSRHFKGPSK